MEPIELKRILENKLQANNRKFVFDSEEKTLRIEDDQSGKGITLSLPGLTAKYEERKDAALDEIIHHVNEVFSVMDQQQPLKDNEKGIYPVIRSTSFPTEHNGDQLIFEEHTAETSVFYAQDLGNSYRLVTQKMLDAEGWDLKQLKEIGRFNLRSLDCNMKEDEVAGNRFYFLNSNDGYDASRILNIQLLEDMKSKVEGTLAVAVPHQDVLIFADIRNEQGYDILGQMAMHFFSNGRVPITALPFLYEDDELDPIFILAKNKPTKAD
ncbi:DUF1444 domain-containing protein [Pseudalkalibacillus berkeleyi]|uniref:DUF1444 domain-containing protein n=1 Tax=Pseudalkalibacillus berkeleyi TaxID=1069813 RepID=A0ABS9H3T4_9BACL|nr:DUF1444 domain-containing protein [Pseudalkalibacillus berkeleyi]MCF6138310.1 DUF1444 domain-containing protein [Pseudalkalibacillus berkeleyi]